MQPGVKFRQALCGLLGAVAFAPVAQAQDSDERSSARIAGTWQIAAPADSFKPETGAIPFTPKGAQAYRENRRLRDRAIYDEYDYAAARCAAPGSARLALTSQPFRIWERPGMTVFQYQWNRLQRQVDMGTLIPQTRQRAEDVLVGRAIPVGKGHLDQGALVVVSTGFSDTTLIDALVPHGWDFKLTERLRLVDANTLENRLTFEDPEMFARPWTAVVRYKRLPDQPFVEDVCLDRRAKGRARL